jgi:hypothetical protein
MGAFSESDKTEESLRMLKVLYGSDIAMLAGELVSENVRSYLNL